MDPHLWLMDPDTGGPETCGSYGSGSATLLTRIFLHTKAMLRIRMWIRLGLKRKCLFSFWRKCKILCILSLWRIFHFYFRRKSTKHLHFRENNFFLQKQLFLKLPRVFVPILHKIFAKTFGKTNIVAKGSQKNKHFRENLQKFNVIKICSQKWSLCFTFCRQIYLLF